MKFDIKRKLDVLKYDPNKHESLKVALNEVLHSEKYNLVVRGIVNDPKLLGEVREILDAYKYLKDNEDLIHNREQYSEKLNEIIIIYDDEKRVNIVYEKNGDTFKELLEIRDIYIGENYILDKDNKEVIYNFLGENILPDGLSWYDHSYDNYEFDPRIEVLSDKLIDVDGTIVCLEKEGGIYKYINKDTYRLSKVIEKLESNELKNYIFNCYYNKTNTTLEYLKYEIVSNIDNYIRCIHDGDIICYDISGEKIISCDKNGYSYIGNICVDKKTNHHIVMVQKKSIHFIDIYGYYDLDDRKELFDEWFNFGLDWGSYGTIVFKNEECYFIDSSLNKLKKENIPIEIKEKPKTCSTLHLLREMLNNNYYFSYEDYNFYVLKDIEMIDDDKCILNYLNYGKMSTHIFCHEVYALGNYNNGNIAKISEYLEKITVDKNSNSIIGYLPSGIDKDWKKVLPNGYLVNIVDENNLNRLLEGSRDIKLLVNHTIVESDFTLPEYKEVICDNLTQDKECNQLIKLSSKELANVRNNILEKYDINRNPCVLEKEKVMNNTIRDITAFSPDGNLIVELETGASYKRVIHHNVVVNKKGIPLGFKHATGVFVDELDNICLKLPYGAGTRYVLTDSLGEVIIGPSREIQKPIDGCYIVKKDKYQLYDSSGIPITYEADMQKWTTKYYVNDSGVIREKQNNLLIENNGNIYLVDGGADITIKENKEYKELMKRLKEEF